MFACSRKLRLDWIDIKRNKSSETSENLYADAVYIGPAYPQGYDTYGMDVVQEMSI